jgi:NAD(P)-dependent dehydrogenase (short-subunit alcohol dehydrogenase family)
MVAHSVEVNVVCPGFIKTPMTDANNFRMPFLMDVARASQIIRTGLARNKARIAFPAIMYAIVWLIAALPQPLGDFVSRNGPRK